MARIKTMVVAVVVASAAAATAGCGSRPSDGPLLAAQSDLVVCGDVAGFTDFVVAVDVVNDSASPVRVTGIRPVGAVNVEATGDAWLLPTDEGGLAAYPYGELDVIAYWDEAEPVESEQVPAEADRMQVVARFLLADPGKSGSLEGFDIEYRVEGGREFVARGTAGVILVEEGEAC